MKHDDSWSRPVNRFGGAVLVAALALQVPAQGEPYYLRYDADQFPEDVAWERHTTDPHKQVVRTLENGSLTIDSRASLGLTDWYVREIPQFQLNTGEQLRVEWQMRAFETQTDWFESDVVLALSNAESEYVQFFLGPDFVAVNEDGPAGPEHLYGYAPDVWHTFQVVSNDAKQYTLSVDGQLAFEGNFTRHLTAGARLIAFGDVVYGRSSLSSWDYVQVEVVPEPNIALLVAVAIIGGSLNNRRERRV